MFTPCLWRLEKSTWFYFKRSIRSTQESGLVESISGIPRHFGGIPKLKSTPNGFSWTPFFGLMNQIQKGWPLTELLSMRNRLHVHVGITNNGMHVSALIKMTPCWLSHFLTGGKSSVDSWPVMIHGDSRIFHSLVNTSILTGLPSMYGIVSIHPSRN